MTGMRGTGSDTVVADEVFVPEEQVISRSKAAAAYRRDEKAERPTLVPVPMPESAMGALAGPVLGMGIAMYDTMLRPWTV